MIWFVVKNWVLETLSSVLEDLGLCMLWIEVKNLVYVRFGLVWFVKIWVYMYGLLCDKELGL